MLTISTEIFLFITPRHPELDSGSHFYFFQKGFWFFFLSLLYFYFFHKNYYHFTKGKEPARSPKPAVSLPLTPSLLGHGSGLCPKNLPTSEIEVSSVSCEQIRVALFFFITLCHPELDSGSHFIFKKFLMFLYHTTSSWTWFRISFYFFKKFLIFLFITSLFLFFHKNYYYII